MKTQFIKTTESEQNQKLYDTKRAERIAYVFLGLGVVYIIATLFITTNI